MTSFNIGGITTINAAQVDTTADKVILWDNSESGAARTKAMTAQQARLLVQGVDTQMGSTKPTQRSDGTSLQVGDRWWDTVENFWWFWNGTYWLSEQIYALNTGLADAIASARFPGGIPIDPDGNDLFIIRFRASVIFAAGTIDGSNFWSVRLRRSTPDNLPNASTGISSLVFNTAPVTTRVSLQNNLSIHVDVSALNVAMLHIDYARSGSPPNIDPNSSAQCLYRLAKP